MLFGFSVTMNVRYFKDERIKFKTYLSFLRVHIVVAVTLIKSIS